MKTHFACLFGHDLDYDLVPHWIKWYDRYRFYSRTIFLHSQTKRDLSFHSKIFEDSGYTVINVSGEQFQAGNIRAKFLSGWHEKIIAQEKENAGENWVFTADSDEFFDIPVNFHPLLEEHDCIKGKFVDCYGKTLKDAEANIPIEYQYPYRGGLSWGLMDHRLSQSDFRLENMHFFKKIIGCRATFIPNYLGSHYFIDGTTFENIRTCGEFDVRHYCWRSTMLHRMLNKEYYSSRHFIAVADMFNISHDHPAIQKRLKEEAEKQKEMGWVPA